MHTRTGNPRSNAVWLIGCGILLVAATLSFINNNVLEVVIDENETSDLATAGDVSVVDVSVQRA